MEKEEIVGENRPKNLNLFTIHFPIPAIVSILHRITGVILFLFIPIMLWALAYSLTDTGFDHFHQWMSSYYFKFFFWLLLIPFFFHLVAGVRHLLSDIHIGDTLKTGRVASIVTFVITAILVLLAGIWIW